MFIKDVVKISADVLNMENVVNYIDNSVKVGDAKEKSEKLTRLTELVINELCQVAFTCCKSDVVTPPTTKVLFSSLSANPIRVLKVTDDNGKEVEFTCFNGGMESPCEISYVEYAYYPKKLELNSQVCFVETNVTEEMIAMGVVAEYLLTIFDFDGALFWHKRFEELVKKCVTLKNSNIKSRSWL